MGLSRRIWTGRHARQGGRYAARLQVAIGVSRCRALTSGISRAAVSLALQGNFLYILCATMSPLCHISPAPATLAAMSADVAFVGRYAMSFVLELYASFDRQWESDRCGRPAGWEGIGAMWMSKAGNPAHCGGRRAGVWG